MKKITAFLLSLLLAFSLAACGDSGPDRQPALDAYNSAHESFQELADVINANPDAYPEDAVTAVSDMSDLLDQHKALLDDDSTDIDEETLDKMIEWYGTVEDWVKEAKAEFGIE